MAANVVSVTTIVPEFDAPADTGACDEFDAALGKVSSLTVVGACCVFYRGRESFAVLF